ncbi:hypothetical protein SAMN05661010_00117 [Modicisalibacter muralis]|uniref:Sulfotransferase family protein n=1 Tax=Modicisalibacter muralis TaxID=119000 RepID=A0A1G9EU18_9GAMM|nr:hypothetical protein [Halomonas muralis]SDK79662.1 hypothetical protein SAMN05661010_00117 [Halomonas muralis]
MLIIHVGAHKTGTTTIQNFLKKEPVILKNSSINYIDIYKDVGAGLVSKLQPEDDLYLKMRVLYSVRDKIDRNYEDDKVNIISSESFFGDFYQAYKNQKYIYSILSEVFSGYSLRVAYLERDISDFFTSLYIQSVQQGRCWSEKKYFELTGINNFSWDEAYTNAISCFGEDRVIRIKMEDASRHEYGLIGGFFKEIGCELNSSMIESNEELKKYNKNISYGRKEVMLARVFNKLTFSKFNKYIRILLARLTLATNSKKYLSKL